MLGTDRLVDLKGVTMHRIPGRILLIAAAFALLLVPVAAIAAGGFTDVDDGNVFGADIQWLADAGVTKGCNPPSNTEFCPGDYVTREQMAAFMHRLSGGDSRTIDGRLDALEAENRALRSLLAGVSRDGHTLLLEGMNLQVVNGTGEGSPSPNGLGNIIIGYNYGSHPAGRTGSHYLVIGERNGYTSLDGIVVGNSNSATAPGASVIGGLGNTASGLMSSVCGGYYNTASGQHATVAGGADNHAIGYDGSVSGGKNNTASGEESSVSGGRGNVAVGNYASVSGGQANYANGDYTSILGGVNIYVNPEHGHYP